MKDKVKIICKKHNLIFEQSLDSHINKNARYPNCSSESNLKIKTDRTKTDFNNIENILKKYLKKS